MPHPGDHRRNPSVHDPKARAHLGHAAGKRPFWLLLPVVAQPVISFKVQLHFQSTLYHT